jgi:hypothetical protein
MIAWRWKDARTNAIGLAAQAMFAPKQLYRKKSEEMLAMLSRRGIDFEAYPAFFRSGTFVRRRTVLRELTPAELSEIPERYRPSGPIARSETAPAECRNFLACTNREAFIFDGADAEFAPVTA